MSAVHALAKPHRIKPAHRRRRKATTGPINRYDYDVYGGTATQTATGFSNPYQYTGRERDANGLYYYRARYYHPGAMRFISEDPIRFNGGDWNTYAYVGGSPGMYSDPTGNIPIVPIGMAYARCLLQCAALAKLIDAFTDGCTSNGDILADCALECLNPFNWGGGKKLGMAGKKVPRKNPRRHRRDWEKENNQQWPKTEDGRNYDAHHKKPLADGGTDDLSNIEPMHPRDHRQHHVDNGDFSRWGSRSGEGN